jgi:hypothetical protein
LVSSAEFPDTGHEFEMEKQEAKHSSAWLNNFNIGLIRHILYQKIICTRLRNREASQECDI